MFTCVYANKQEVERATENVNHKLVTKNKLEKFETKSQGRLIKWKEKRLCLGVQPGRERRKESSRQSSQKPLLYKVINRQEKAGNKLKDFRI